MIKNMLIANVQKALNTYIHLDPEATKQLGQLANNVLAITIVGPQLTVFLKFTPQRIHILDHYPLDPTATLSGTPYALAKLMRTERQQVSQLFQEEVTLTGDIKFAEHVKAFFDSIDIDWEEHLSSFTGDVVAQQVGDAARTVEGIFSSISDSLQQNMTEYLQYEICQLPPRREVEQFIKEIDELQLAVDRLSAQLRQAV